MTRIALVLALAACSQREGTEPAPRDPPPAAPSPADPPRAEPRLVGTWRLVIEPDERPPLYYFATVISGTFVFDERGDAVRTLVTKGAPGDTRLEKRDDTPRTTITRYHGMHFETEGGVERLTYQAELPGGRRIGGSVRDAMDGSDLWFIDESQARLHFKRRP
ncbi:MAG TPA: hypothetical protein VL463_37055 [Kofleriaceae bacterium]|nr:hypothetical protein [Kofleriaceae bacterium]